MRTGETGRHIRKMAAQNAGQEAGRAKTKGSKSKVLSAEAAYALFDQQARRALNMSGQDFIKQWDAGELIERADDPEVMRVVRLLPFGRSR